MITKTNSKKFAFFTKLPYWLLLLVLLAIVLLWAIANSENYYQIFFSIVEGIGVTVYVTLIAFSFAILLGLAMALTKMSQLRVLREIATFYIEVIRGIPMLVLLYYIAFVGAPELVKLLNFIVSPLVKLDLIEYFSVRSLNFTWRAILALMIGYSAFIAEIFRSGIESVSEGQKEACQTLGLTKWQSMRLVILPQAFRTSLPPLGNDFVAMVKDSALVSALGVQDITQLGKIYSASTFLFFETYNIVAFLYLSITVSLSLCIKILENNLKKYKKS